MNYFDLHCDTAYELYHRKQGLGENRLSVSLENYSYFDKKAQIFAIWSDNKIPKAKAFEDFSAIFDYLKNQISKNEDRAVLCLDSSVLSREDNRLKVIPSVEGADILETDIKRLEFLREKGVRVLTPAWKGENNCCGAFDTAVGLTDFGYRVIEECERLGIIIDVSHMSEKSFWDFANVAKMPFFASHSNSASCCLHPRNLSDTQLRTIVTGGGVVGVSFVGEHLSKAFSMGEASMDTELRYTSEEVYETVVGHIVHFVKKGCDKNVCIGSDFDGTPALLGLESPRKIFELREYMVRHGASDSFINDIFYQNAFNFFANNL